MSHHCHANDCPVITSPAMLMCARHWRMVPKAMQARVWSTFKARGGVSDAPGSWADYYEACADAVEYVAFQEGKPIANTYRAMVPKWRAMAEAKKLAFSERLLQR